MMFACWAMTRSVFSTAVYIAGSTVASKISGTPWRRSRSKTSAAPCVGVARRRSHSNANASAAVASAPASDVEMSEFVVAAKL